MIVNLPVSEFGYRFVSFCFHARFRTLKDVGGTHAFLFSTDMFAGLRHSHPNHYVIMSIARTECESLRGTFLLYEDELTSMHQKKLHIRSVDCPS